MKKKRRKLITTNFNRPPFSHGDADGSRTPGRIGLGTPLCPTPLHRYRAAWPGTKLVNTGTNLTLAKLMGTGTNIPASAGQFRELRFRRDFTQPQLQPRMSCQ